jgi:uncharacterized membrane protein YczE
MFHHAYFPEFVMFIYSLIALIVGIVWIFISERLKDEIGRLATMLIGAVFIIMSLSFSPIPMEILLDFTTAIQTYAVKLFPKSQQMWTRYIKTLVNET